MDAPKYGLDQLVSYDNCIYRIKQVHALNWSMKNPFVYGLILAHKSPPNIDGSKLVYVCEQHLTIATEHQCMVWELLYGTTRHR